MEIDIKVKFNDTKTAFSYKSDAELKKANFIFTLVNNPVISSLAIRAVRLGLFLRLPIKGLIKNTVFDHFCGGESIEQCRPIIKKISDHNVRAILDYSVEGAKTEEGFDQTTVEILQTFDEAKSNDSIPFGVFKMTGLADTALLEKINSKKTLTAEEVSAFERVRNRVDKICKKAYEYQIQVLIDAEETWIQDPIDQLAYEMMQKYNTTSAIVFNTYQMYRADMLTNMRNAHHEATMHNYYLGVKMVRGAYMEKERERAEKMNYPDPIQPSKEATDDSFNKALAFCIDNKQRISLMCGSHNEYSNQFLTVLLEKHNMKKDDGRVWFAQLFGMSDTISFNLAKEGYNVAKYLPYGPVKAVVPYLLRRAEENTSVAGQSSRELTQIRTELARRKSA
ncbi:MAG TPA: proline dehydrogenase family protein [Cyclobacteriaceae bacterium]|nr:proline dehydrogenase family protein [Cyclobacteriaceae bacterium]HNP06501.1 proline dehydrogenase family protein [Cyclobacteriaceae bacterium]HRK52506.1 proline dehydrogenase family protein [Cyclobacteriaceae bacterium]